MTTQQNEVVHDQPQSRFIVEREQGTAELSYELQDDSVIHFIKTFVPPELRKQQIAEKLVRTGLAWAKDNNKTVTTQCWYVEKFLS